MLSINYMEKSKYLNKDETQNVENFISRFSL